MICVLPALALNNCCTSWGELLSFDRWERNRWLIYAGLCFVKTGGIALAKRALIQKALFTGSQPQQSENYIYAYFFHFLSLVCVERIFTD